MFAKKVSSSSPLELSFSLLIQSSLFPLAFLFLFALPSFSSANPYLEEMPIQFLFLFEEPPFVFRDVLTLD